MAIPSCCKRNGVYCGLTPSPAMAVYWGCTRPSSLCKATSRTSRVLDVNGSGLGLSLRSTGQGSM